MNDHKKNNDKKLETSTQQTQTEWMFSIDKQFKEEPIRVENKVEKERRVGAQKNNLSLAEVPKGVGRTRNEMYNDLQEKHAALGDVYELASFSNRGMAFVIDQLVLSGLFYISYHFQFFTHEFAMAINLIIFYFIFFIFPLKYYNATIGKKLMKINLRGTDEYTLGLLKIILRELIVKPISLGILIGFIVPFFNKKRRSLHDYLTGTIVITLQ